MYFTVIQRNNVVVSHLANEIMKVLLRGEAVQGVDDCADLPANCVCVYIYICLLQTNKPSFCHNVKGKTVYVYSNNLVIII